MALVPCDDGTDAKWCVKLQADTTEDLQRCVLSLKKRCGSRLRVVRVRVDKSHKKCSVFLAPTVSPSLEWAEKVTQCLQQTNQAVYQLAGRGADHIKNAMRGLRVLDAMLRKICLLLKQEPHPALEHSTDECAAEAGTSWKLLLQSALCMPGAAARVQGLFAPDVMVRCTSPKHDRARAATLIRNAHKIAQALLQMLQQGDAAGDNGNDHNLAAASAAAASSQVFPPPARTIRGINNQHVTPEQELRALIQLAWKQLRTMDMEATMNVALDNDDDMTASSRTPPLLTWSEVDTDLDGDEDDDIFNLGGPLADHDLMETAMGWPPQVGGGGGGGGGASNIGIGSGFGRLQLNVNVSGGGGNGGGMSPLVPRPPTIPRPVYQPVTPPTTGAKT